MSESRNLKKFSDIMENLRNGGSQEMHEIADALGITWALVQLRYQTQKREQDCLQQALAAADELERRNQEQINALLVKKQ